MDTGPQSKRRHWLVFGGVTLFVIGLLAGMVVYGLNRSEPSIRGRKLMEWIEQAKYSKSGSPVFLEARQAIQDIGTNAAPYLLLCLEGKPTSMDRMSDKLRAKGFNEAARWLVRFGPRTRQNYAAYGLRAIGADLTAVAESLARTADQFPSPQANNAIALLAESGRAGHLQLVSRFPHGSKAGSALHAKEWECVHAFAGQRFIEPEAIAALTAYANDTETGAWKSALRAVEQLEGNAGLKRILANRAFRHGDEYPVAMALTAIEATPELVEEYRTRIEAAKTKLANPQVTELANRLLALPKIEGQ